MPTTHQTELFFQLAKAGCGRPSCIIIFQIWQDRRGLVNQSHYGFENEKATSANTDR